MHASFPRSRVSPAHLRVDYNDHADPSGIAYASSLPRRLGFAVREDVAQYAAYEDEGSERRALGSIGVAADARWMATLTVPIPDDGVAFVHLERRGALPAGYRGSEEGAALSTPIDEIEALVALLAGVLAQARRDGVLPE